MRGKAQKEADFDWCVEGRKDELTQCAAPRTL